jgi:hypothetical protein
MLLTIPQVVSRFADLGVEYWHIDRLCRSGLIQYQQPGHDRLIEERDLPRVRAVLAEEGRILKERR